MKPAFIVPASYGSIAVRVPTDSHRRMALAEWVTARDNPFFAKSTVNRVWSYFFGRGIIDPGGRYPRFQSTQQSRAAGCAHQGFHRSQLRSSPAHADHRQFAHLSGRHDHQRMERQGLRQFLACRSAPPGRGGIDGRAHASHRRAAQSSRSSARYDAPSSCPIRTSARMGSWICSGARRANRPASASAAAISAFRRR